MKSSKTYVWVAVALSVAATLPVVGAEKPRGDGRVQEIVSKALEAHGGRERIESLRSLEIEASYRYFSPDMQSHIDDRTRILFPHGLWQTREISGETVIRQLDANGASIDVAGNRQHLDDSFAEKLRMYLCLRRLEILSLCEGLTLRAVDSAEDGLERVAADLHGKAFAELGIDPSTWLVVSMSYDEELISFAGDEDANARTEVRFSDFQPTDGLMMARRVERFTDGERSSFYTVDSIAINRADTVAEVAVSH